MTRYDIILETVNELLEFSRAAHRTAFRKNLAYLASNTLMDVFDRPRWIISNDPIDQIYRGSPVQGNAILDPEAKSPTWKQARTGVEFRGITRPGIIQSIEMALRGSPERLRIAKVLRDLRQKGTGQAELDTLSNLIYKPGEGYKTLF